MGIGETLVNGLKKSAAAVDSSTIKQISAEQRIMNQNSTHAKQAMKENVTDTFHPSKQRNRVQSENPVKESIATPYPRSLQAPKSNLKINGKAVSARKTPEQLRKEIKKAPANIMDSSYFDVEKALSESPSSIIDVPQGKYAFSNSKPLVTTNLQQCIAVIAWDPVTKQAGLAHVDYFATPESINKFAEELSSMSGNRPLEVSLVGGEMTIKEPISRNNIKKVMAQLKKMDVNVVSADVQGKTHPSSIAFDPQTGTLHQGGGNIHRRYDEHGQLTKEAKGIDYPQIDRHYAKKYSIPKHQQAIGVSQEMVAVLQSGGQKKFTPTRGIYHAQLKQVPKMDLKRMQ